MMTQQYGASVLGPNQIYPSTSMPQPVTGTCLCSYLQLLQPATGACLCSYLPLLQPVQVYQWRTCIIEVLTGIFLWHSLHIQVILNALLQQPESLRRVYYEMLILVHNSISHHLRC